MIYPVDTDTSDTTKRYALDESKVGGLAFVRSNGKAHFAAASTAVPALIIDGQRLLLRPAEQDRILRARSVVGVAGRRILLFATCRTDPNPAAHPPLRARSVRLAFARRLPCPRSRCSRGLRCARSHDLDNGSTCELLRVCLRTEGCGAPVAATHNGDNPTRQSRTNESCTQTRSVRKPSNFLF